MQDKISYNLPGYGLIRPQLFPYTQEVFDFLKDYGHLKQLKETNQLGTLRKVYPGAHHTRYEYVIAQLALITELCYLKGPQEEEFRLSAHVSDFGKLNYIEDEPSKGEIIQILTVLSNIGHMTSTFAGERAFLHYISTDSVAKGAFRKGLPSEDIEEFDKALNSFNIHKINYFIALFLLSRYKRKKHGTQIIPFCQNIIRSYLGREGNKDSRMGPAWELYQSIRKLAYLALDSLYTPVPFSLDLSSIFLSFDHYQKEVFARESSFQDALSRLEGVMRDSVYLAPKALLQIAMTSENTYEKLSIQETEGNIGGIKPILSPKSNLSIFSDALSEGQDYAEVERYVALSFDCSPSIRNRELVNTVEWEIETRSRVGIRFSRFGAEWDPSQTHLRIAAAVEPNCQSDKIEEVSFRIARELSKLEIQLSKKMDLDEASRYENGKSIVEFLCRSLWGWEKRYQLRDRFIGKNHLLFINNGSTDTADLLSKCANSAKERALLDQDTLHELNVLTQELEDVQYRGLLAVYAGSLVVANQTREVVEFDGIVFFLGREQQNRRGFVVEAKNKNMGSTEARNDLEEKASKLKMTEGSFSVQTCKGGAILSIQR